MAFSQRLGADFYARVHRDIRDRMAETGIDLLLLDANDDVIYTTGFSHYTTERPVVFAITQAGAWLLLGGGLGGVANASATPGDSLEPSALPSPPESAASARCRSYDAPWREISSIAASSALQPSRSAIGASRSSRSARSSRSSRSLESASVMIQASIP